VENKFVVERAKVESQGILKEQKQDSDVCKAKKKARTIAKSEEKTRRARAEKCKYEDVKKGL